MGAEGSPLRLFLDAGVIIEGCASKWGAAKAVVILATQRQEYTVVLAEQIEREIARAVVRKRRRRSARISPAGSRAYASNGALRPQLR